MSNDAINPEMSVAEADALRQRLAAMQGLTASLEENLHAVTELAAVPPLAIPDAGMASLAGLLGQPTVLHTEAPEGGQDEARTASPATEPAPPAISNAGQAVAAGLTMPPAMHTLAIGGVDAGRLHSADVARAGDGGGTSAGREAASIGEPLLTDPAALASPMVADRLDAGLLAASPVTLGTDTGHVEKPQQASSTAPTAVGGMVPPSGSSIEAAVPSAPLIAEPPAIGDLAKPGSVHATMPAAPVLQPVGEADAAESLGRQASTSEQSVASPAPLIAEPPAIGDLAKPQIPRLSDTQLAELDRRYGRGMADQLLQAGAVIQAAPSLGNLSAVANTGTGTTVHDSDDTVIESPPPLSQATPADLGVIEANDDEPDSSPAAPLVTPPDASATPTVGVGSPAGPDAGVTASATGKGGTQPADRERPEPSKGKEPVLLGNQVQQGRQRHRQQRRKLIADFDVHQGLHGIVEGLAGHVGNMLGGQELIPGLGITANHIADWAGVGSVGNLLSDAVPGLFGMGNDTAETLMPAGAATGGVGAAEGGSGEGSIGQKLDRIIELLAKLADGAKAKDGSPDGLRPDGSFTPTLQGNAAAAVGQAAGAAGGQRPASGNSSDDMTQQLLSVLTRVALQAAVAAL